MLVLKLVTCTGVLWNIVFCQELTLFSHQCIEDHQNGPMATQNSTEDITSVVKGVACYVCVRLTVWALVVFQHFWDTACPQFPFALWSVKSLLVLKRCPNHACRIQMNISDVSGNKPSSTLHLFKFNNLHLRAHHISTEKISCDMDEVVDWKLRLLVDFRSLSVEGDIFVFIVHLWIDWPMKSDCLLSAHLVLVFVLFSGCSKITSTGFWLYIQ
jgi:hypothetical protein